MTLRQPHRTTARRGATIVEAAVVISLFLLFLFSIFEYGRYVMMENLLVNAAREGCRYALVHSQDPTVVADVQAQVRSRLGGQDTQLPDLNISVFPTNSPSAALSTINPDDPITVRVTGTFSTMLPSMFFLPSSFTIRSSSIMTCEGN
jgi:Flp pilus assembly protein TadG